MQDYLSQYIDESRITIVGPLHQAGISFHDPVIFVDGGSKFREDDQGFSVGDGDSYPAQLDHTLNPDKDFSDLAFVLRNLPKHFSHIELTGFLGGRRDHELFNLGETHHLLKSCTDTSVYFENQISVFSKGEWEFEAQGTFSLAVLEPTTLTLKGDCQYQCMEATDFDPLTSHGLSNQGFGTIQLKCNRPVFIFFNPDMD